MAKWNDTASADPTPRSRNLMGQRRVRLGAGRHGISAGGVSSDHIVKETAHAR